MILSPIEWVVAALLCAWLILSLCHQFARGRAWPRAWDSFNLLPRWSFFAPEPGRNDFHLVYREWSGDTVSSGWTELHALRPRQWWTAVWNPTKRHRKVIIDVAQTLLGNDTDSSLVDTRSRMLTLAYLACLNAVNSVGPVDWTRQTSREFMIVLTWGGAATDTAEILFRSERHSLRPLVDAD